MCLSALALTTALALTCAAPALGAAGDPDPSFDGDGMATTAFGTTPFHPADNGNAAARLSTGEVYEGKVKCVKKKKRKK